MFGVGWIVLWIGIGTLLRRCLRSAVRCCRGGGRRVTFRIWRGRMRRWWLRRRVKILFVIESDDEVEPKGWTPRFHAQVNRCIP